MLPKILLTVQNLLKFSSNIPPDFFQINVFLAFALGYLTTDFLWPSPLFFHCFVSHSVALYTVPLRMRGASTFAFKFLQNIYRYGK